MVPHAFNSRTRYEPGDDRDIWCKDCEYHREHDIHKASAPPLAKRGTQEVTDFEIFALDHAKHNHCKGCGGCLVDPSHVVQAYAAWCVGCRDRIKANCVRQNIPLPWAGGWELA